MTNVTLSIDEEKLKQARILALQEGASLNAVIREFVESYIAGHKHYQQVTGRILQQAEHSRYNSGGRTWSREEVHER